MIPLACGQMLPAQEFAAIRRRLMLDYCKWDPQVEDVAALCRFPLLLQRSAWDHLRRSAEQLFRETLAVEQELLHRVELLRALGLPSAIVRLLSAGGSPATPTIARVMRFDFHWTIDGWRISEVNSDVPGGFIEASPFTNLVADSTACGIPTGDPAAIYTDCIAASLSGAVGLVHATAYSDDRQVMTYLGQLLNARGVSTYLVSPADVTWQNGSVALVTPGGRVVAAGLVRFFPAEWLPDLGRRSGWERFFCGSQVPLSNPAWSLLSQSKRWPLVWDELDAPIAAWRRLLPETRDPRAISWSCDRDWVLKPALGRIGESIGMRGVTAEKSWTSIARSARWWPRHWVAQRRFESVPVDSQIGQVHPSIGVYVVEGKVAGVYGRLARRPLIDHLAQDVAVLIPEPNRVPEPDDSGMPMEVCPP